MLHLTKVAVGAPSLDALCAAMAARTMGGEVFVTTRNRPTRHAELIGGSIYWIIKHRLVARQTIIGFGDDAGRCAIRLDPRVVPVRAQPRRAHQGWRYLAAADAPADFTGVDADAALPEALLRELAELALI
ncbi:DUF1489 family protein [Sphingomonas changnyeongensis]|uniref:DUF1489 family protein n=1 Tax=Sphingomonas changnyeongensis TaxID=2698679 RepID=A0A7Z2S7X5_9SPHN|nr:DUF1489 domain-containing protein [Sphingomonas changnyeongensis]QHL90087.1 DUF1489 family protein [Sphingomonas changnyeongensis]